VCTQAGCHVSLGKVWCAPGLGVCVPKLGVVCTQAGCHVSLGKVWCAPGLGVCVPKLGVSCVPRVGVMCS
jgi:hypothetical protein